MRETPHIHETQQERNHAVMRSSRLKSNVKNTDAPQKLKPAVHHTCSGGGEQLLVQVPHCTANIALPTSDNQQLILHAFRAFRARFYGLSPHPHGSIIQPFDDVTRT